MAERIADVRRKLHEALDVIAARDEVISGLRADLEAVGRRLSTEVGRRRAADDRVLALEGQLADVEERLAHSVPRYPAPGGRAGVKELLQRALDDLVSATTMVMRGLWHRVPERVRGGVWTARRAVGRG